MLILATIADMLMLAGACAVLIVAYCAACDLLDEAIGRLWRGNHVRR